MNKITYFLLLCSVFGFSQNITFNDSDLLTYLTTKLCVDTDGDGVFDSTADFNNDNQIQLSEANQVTHFKFNSLAHNIQSLGGFENFSNLIFLEVTTIDVNYLDFSIWQSLQTLKLSSSIDSFTFNNPSLTHFELQNVGFNNPLFDLTNLPSLEYVKIQSSHLTENLVFGTHNNLEELRIFAGTYSSLNLSGMPALKYLTIDEFVGASIDISNNTLLEEFIFRYTDNLNSILGSDASAYLEKIDFIQDGYYNNIPSNLDLVFNNQALTDIEIRGVNSFSLSNNNAAIGDLELWNINESLNINNSNFTYIDSSLDASLFVGNINSDEINLTNIEGLRFLTFQSVSTNNPLDLSTVKSERISLSSSNLTELNLKNGNILQQFYSNYDTDIQFICVDIDELSVVENGYQNDNSSVVIHPYCTFVLGGEYYEITGNILVDLGTGCLPYTTGSIFDLQFTVTDNNNSDIFYVNNLNEYYYTLPEGNHTVSSQLVESDYWTITPSSIDLSFPSNPSPYIQDVCIAPSGVYNDLEIMIVPIEAARPGFDTDYKIIFKNKGNTTLSGSIDFTFDDNYMNLLSSNPMADSQTIGNLVWNYANLQPFEIREVSLTMTLNTPADANFPLNSGDFLNYSATINPVVSDETPDDNTTNLNQEAVNSYDPNDITCLEGEAVTLHQVGKYVHYLIRFENTGSTSAVNIVVKDVIDVSKYDISTLLPLNASHDFYTRIRNGNALEFIFENIQLPSDSNNNNGYILFKIKTLPTLSVGDSFSNQANIYFDYNAPIITNNETTVIQENLSIDVFNLPDIKIYPNPTADYFKIENLSSSNIKTIELYNISGKKLKEFSISENYEINDLSTGVYFIKIKTERTETNRKLIKI
ncbi:putative repeat protein (TIGR01451 family)/predicted secreted protein (Por secretion system target) [Winogradskyella pacifica]|uniref:Putative repeat protein (TIGR01451 family)/predicted secreted protein (Por secretion system target) n=1 Tax=Winogradskyella pacifica TaxID=664642 RepID=A0A3D9N003_9FLAO|nr:T9SS type A sorting domain-containing protein [Winogradskyella pacifica]REE24856.1 putative repeat protein (TIGR01451 family)/predicted secreted protein (Por secretion system target) [Winogradskyella pacifica]